MESMVSTIPLISIVDDDLSVRRSLRRLVQSAGYAVATFASAREFLDSTALALAACVVLDISMEGMSGFDLQAQLASSLPLLPIIFITALDDPATRERFRRSGVAEMLRKPFDEHALFRAITRALDQGPIDQGPIDGPGRVQ
jgi:FixJ family two-component response regulator